MRILLQEAQNNDIIVTVSSNHLSVSNNECIYRIKFTISIHSTGNRQV